MNTYELCKTPVDAKVITIQTGLSTHTGDSIEGGKTEYKSGYRLNIRLCDI